jgi:hypothetical protein
MSATLAALPVGAAKGLAVAASAIGAAAATAVADPAGIHTALAHVPTWTHAYEVLRSIATSFQGGTHPAPPPPTHPGPPPGHPGASAQRPS